MPTAAVDPEETTMFDTPFIIPVVAIIAWAVVAVVRARHGLGDGDALGDPTHPGTPSTVAKLLERELATRDEQISELRERIRVLEKIVIDAHNSNTLSDEIDRLRDAPGPGR
jgi:hypothetical protein